MMHSPTAGSKLNSERIAELIPPMYTRILEHSAHRMNQDYAQTFSRHLESYESSQDKEATIR